MIRADELVHVEEAKRQQEARQHPHEHAKAASKQGLELRVGVLPHTDVILFRFVEPITGKVVREFPPEGLAEALAEMRAKAAAHLDRKA